MSQNKIIIKNSNYARNISSSRSSEPIKKFKTKFEVAKRTITKLKPSESTLMKENQSFYKYQYSLQDKADDTNIVFFDANSRKFRTRSSNKGQNLKSFNNSRNVVSSTNINKNGKYNTKLGKSFSNIRNANNNLINIGNYNEKRGMTLNNNSNKINLINISEKNIKNPENRSQVIKQLKKEKEELLGKTNSNRKNQQEKNIYNKDKINNTIKPYTNKINTNNNNSNQKSINRNILQNMSNSNNNRKPQTNTNSNFMTKSVDKIQKSQLKNRQDDSTKNKLNSANPQTNQKKQADYSQYNKSNTNNKINPDKEQNKNQKLETSEKKEERTIILVPGQTIEKRSVVENFENPIEELIENPDGTYSSIIKQTKVTTITENIPIEGNKIKAIEGAPELPMYKQQMTHIYKTVTSVSQKPGQGISNKNTKSQNVNNDTNIKNKSNNNITNENRNNNNNNYNNNEDNINSNIDKNNLLNDNINKVNIKSKLNKSVKFGEMSPQKDNKTNNEKNKYQSNNSKSKGFKDDKEMGNILEKNGNIGNNYVSPEEKEKQMKNIKDLFSNISKGKNAEENIEKLSKLLANMDEKERKELLEKLGKDLKNSNLLQKLTKSVENQVLKNSIKNQNDEYNNSAKGFSSSKKFDTGMKSLYSEITEVREINPLKFDGLFLEINENTQVKKEKNPFEGPSPYIDFYKERSIKIKEKINRLSMTQSEQNEKKEN